MNSRGIGDELKSAFYIDPQHTQFNSPNSNYLGLQSRPFHLLFGSISCGDTDGSAVGSEVGTMLDLLGVEKLLRSVDAGVVPFFGGDI